MKQDCRPHARVGPRRPVWLCSAIGCGSSPAPKAQNAGNAEGEETGTMGGEATEHDTISKAGAAELIPKEKKRAITEDQRADFEKAMQRYASAKKSGGLSGGECSSVSDAFKSVADSNPGLLEARFNQGAVLAECGREDDAERIWKGHDQLRAGHHQPRLPGLEAGRAGEAESHFNQRHQGRPAAHRRGAQQPGADPARQGPPRRAATRRSSTSRRRSATCAPCWRSTATTSRRSRRWRSSTTT